MFKPMPGSRAGKGVNLLPKPSFGQMVAPYLGQVATRCFMPDSSTTNSTTGWNCRCAHYARVPITGLQVVYPNFYVSAGGGENYNGGTRTITASIEVGGKFIQNTFGGSTSTVIQEGGMAWTDYIPVSIPANTLFFTREYQVNSIGIECCSSLFMNTALGDSVDNANVDKTMSGTITNIGSQGLIAPCAIVGYTTAPSIFAIGASRMGGLQDSTVDSTGDTGYSRLFGGNFAYISCGAAGDTTSAWVTGATKRFLLGRKYCSHFWLDCSGGLNDFNSNGTAVGPVEGWLTVLMNMWPKKSRIILSDGGPWTTSSNNWSNTAGQTATSWETSRQTLNTFVNSQTGFNQKVAIDATDRTGTGSAFAWRNNGTGDFYTPDGIHETTTALLALKTANIFNPSLVTMKN